MTVRYLMATTFVVCVFSLCVADCQAQVTPGAPNIRPPRPNPTISPYLNLLNRNNSTAFNYFALVRPQREFRQGHQNLGGSVNRLQDEVDANRNAILNQQPPIGQSLLSPTGHTTGYLNTGGYFGVGR